MKIVVFLFEVCLIVMVSLVLIAATLPAIEIIADEITGWRWKLYRKRLKKGDSYRELQRRC